jgi:hypothetical protein
MTSRVAKLQPDGSLSIGRLRVGPGVLGYGSAGVDGCRLGCVRAVHVRCLVLERVACGDRFLNALALPLSARDNWLVCEQGHGKRRIIGPQPCCTAPPFCIPTQCATGTIVYEGMLDGRAVAVKRLLRQFYDLAKKEIEVLIMSDEHPNVVRCFAMEEDREFVYLALEKCRNAQRLPGHATGAVPLLPLLPLLPL